MRRKRLRGAALVLGIAAIIVAGVSIWGVIQFNRIERVDVKLAKVVAEQPTNFLIVGSDTRDLKKTGSADDAAIFGGGTETAPGGARADTIVIARIDPAKTAVELLSIPRDLWVTMPSGKSSRINGAYNSGPQDLIDTIRKNLGVPINHYVEVNFDGFKGLVEAVDGVPLYFSQPVRDRNSGLRVARSGCYTLNGVQALAFARARHLQYFDGTRWRTDGTGDLGRITRQQIFLRHAVGKLSTLGLTDLSSMRQLVNVAIDTVRLDATLGADEILSLGQKFRHFDSKSMVMHSLPADPFTTSSGAAVLKLEKTAAQPVLSIFNGKRPTTTVQATTTTVLAPEAITVDVKNAAGTPGLARNVATMLGSGGFVIGEVGNAATATASTVRYGTGAEASAKLVAERVTPHPKVVADSTLAAGKVVFVAAAEPESVAKSTSSTKTTTTIKQASTSAKSSTTTVKQSGTSAKSASTNGSSTAGSGSPTTTAAGATSDPAEGHTIGLKVGDPPPGVTCG